MPLKKLIAGLLCAVFTATSVVPQEALANVAHPISEISIPNTLMLSLPEDIGSIDSFFHGEDTAILHIQEAHGHPEAQKNISKILH